MRFYIHTYVQAHLELPINCDRCFIVSNTGHNRQILPRKIRVKIQRKLTQLARRRQLRRPNYEDNMYE